MIGFLVWFQSFGCHVGMRCDTDCYNWIWSENEIKIIAVPDPWVTSYFCAGLIIPLRLGTSMIQVLEFSKGKNRKNSSFEVRHSGNFHFDSIPDCINSTKFRIHYYYYCYISKAEVVKHQIKMEEQHHGYKIHRHVYSVPKWKCVFS